MVQIMAGKKQHQQHKIKKVPFEVHVYDTYVLATNNHTMHFNVVIPKKDIKEAIKYAKEWLEKTKQNYDKVTANECRYCHSQLAPDIIKNRVRIDGYFVQAMEGCKDEE